MKRRLDWDFIIVFFFLLPVPIIAITVGVILTSVADSNAKIACVQAGGEVMAYADGWECQRTPRR